MIQPLDYAALSEPLTKTDIAIYKQRNGSRWDLSFLAPVVILALPAAVLLGISAVEDNMFLFVFFLILLGVLGYLIHLYLQRSIRRRAKLYKFAVYNGLQLVSDVVNPSYPGMIFDKGHGRQLDDALIFSDGTEMGNYTYVTGSGKNSQTHDWGYVKIKLDRRLPHMVLDTNSNNFWKLSNLSNAFDRSQILKLEGDFNSYFTLYAPKQYERDALYVFTPDVMATMIDYGRDYDIEIVDDELYIYFGTHYPLDSIEFYEHMIKVINTIKSEMVEQTDYYADERIGDRAVNMVATQGQRLKPGLNWVIMIIILLVIYFSVIHPLVLR